MAENLCKTEEEVEQIIAVLQADNANWDTQLIRRAINSCCLESKIIKSHETFISCVRERVVMLKEI